MPLTEFRTTPEIKPIVSPPQIRGEFATATHARCDRNGGEGSLLILLNPGRVTRHFLCDMAAAAGELGIPTVTLELGDVWEAKESGQPFDEQAMIALLRRHNVRAVLGYTFNGLFEWPATTAPDGRPIPFFERMGIPHLMWWTDHPHWAHERAGLRPDWQPILRSPNHYSFVKSTLAARELQEFLHWPHCWGLPVAENSDRLKPVSNPYPRFDVVAITGSPPNRDTELENFLADDDPDIAAISAIIARRVGPRLIEHWMKSAPSNRHRQLTTFASTWVDARSKEPLTASYRLFRRLEPHFPEAAQWLRKNPMAYFDAIEILWEFGKWQRTFYLAYLAKYFKVGVFGADWSSMGIAAGGWVDHDDQPSAYAEGKVAVNISQAGEEEGLAHKPFQIAACGVPMAHIERKGLADCFTPGVEVATFLTPKQARDAIGALLSDPDARRRMADAARERLRREHTWKLRLPQMLELAKVRTSSG